MLFIKIIPLKKILRIFKKLLKNNSDSCMMKVNKEETSCMIINASNIK